MIQELPIRKPLFSIAEIAVAFICVGIGSQAIAFDRAFSGFWTVIPLAILAVFFGIYTLVRSRASHALPFGIVAVSIAMLNLPTVPKMFPLRYKVQPASFKDAKVADILQHIAQSNDDRPSWRFHVSDQHLGYTRVTMTIPDHASLSQALDLLMTETGASYTWNWHKFCGNEPSPLCASFYVSHDAYPSRDLLDYKLLISRDNIFDNSEHGITNR
jgi:hypothetical protein